MKSRILMVVGLSMAVWTANASAEAMNEEEELALIYGDKTTVSIATGSKQLLRSAPSVATVITAEDIKAMGARNLDEVMESVPGVHVTRSGVGYFSIYSIRGIGVNQNTNPQVLMLQNGIPTSSVYRGDRGGIIGVPLLENIERIEIIRGPGSALYGADAFAGVVNIITKTAATAPGTTSGVRVGSFNSQNVWVQHGSQHDEFDVAAYLQAGHTDGAGQIVEADAATRLNRAFGGSSSYAPGPLNTDDKLVDSQLDMGYDKWRLRAGYKWREGGTGAGTSYALSPVSWQKGNHANVDLIWKDAQFSQDLGLEFAASYLRHVDDMHVQMYPPGTRLPSYTVSATTPAEVQALLGPVGTVVSGTFTDGMMGTPARWERQYRLATNATYSGFDNHTVRLGAGHDDLNMYQIRTIKNFWLRTDGPAALIGVPVPTGFLIDYSTIQPHLLPHRRLNDYVYAQDEWKFARDWALTAGVRNDNFSDFGSTTNPRLALVWDATYDLTAKLLYGQAFRAPSFNEQYGVNPTGDGNPNIKPERIKMMEAALSWQARSDTRLNLNLFRHITRDTIRTVAKPGGVGSQFTNTGQVHGNGVEIEAEWLASRNVVMTVNFAWQETIDEATNTDAGYAPRKHAFARSDWRLAGDWMLCSQVNWVADRRRVQGDTRPAVPNYTTFDLALHTLPENGSWDISAAVLNLFNTSAREPSLYTAAPGNVPTYPTSLVPYDLPVAPRTLWLQLEYKL